MEKLLCALRFYASNTFNYTTGDAQGPSRESVRRAIREVTSLINVKLSDRIKWPDNQDACRRIASNFFSLARPGMPAVCGAVDGTLVKLAFCPNEHERVALKKLPMGTTKKFNLYLEHAMPSQLEKSEEVERGKILVSVCYNIQQGSLFVNIKRCAELLGMDSTGFSDPYCKVSLTPLSSKAHRQKTSIKKRTLNPEFNTTLQFIVPFKDLPKKTLEISVYDHDVARSDDFIGGILLSTAAKDDRGKQWIQCIENPGKTFESWHKLTIE